MYKKTINEPPPFVTRFHAFTEYHQNQNPALKKCCDCSHFCHLIVNFLKKLRALILIVTAITGLLVFYFTFHFFVSPSIKTLSSGLRKAHCKIVYSHTLEGKNNCSWSSCRVGCTNEDIYVCWQVFVLVTNSLDNSNQGETVSSDNSLPENFNISKSFNDYTKFFTSVPGCVYTSCYPFWDKFGTIGYELDCYASWDNSLAVPSVDYDEVKIDLIYGLTPIVLSSISIVSIYCLYCRRNSTDKTLRLAPDENVSKEKQKQNQLKVLQKLHDENPKDMKISFKTAALAIMAGRNEVSPACPRLNEFRSDSSTNLLQGQFNGPHRPDAKQRWKTAKFRMMKETSKLRQQISRF